MRLTAAGHLCDGPIRATGPSASEGEVNSGAADVGLRRRRDGRGPAELTIAMTAAYTRLGPRIWLAGRRLMSMSVATRRALSATAAVISSLRVPPLKSLYRFDMTPSA
jgi:hypothetical protein